MSAGEAAANRCGDKDNPGKACGEFQTVVVEKNLIEINLAETKE